MKGICKYMDVGVTGQRFIGRRSLGARLGVS